MCICLFCESRWQKYRTNSVVTICGNQIISAPLSDDVTEHYRTTFNDLKMVAHIISYRFPFFFDDSGTKDLQ